MTGKFMTKITAIELENFQSIERRTRIELKPITLLYGPNSAGKSSVFDALELLQILLDPAKFDQIKAADMVDRWARRPGADGWRETSLAVEFPFRIEETWDAVNDLWRLPGNWADGEVRTDAPGFWLDFDDEDFVNKVSLKTVRIELTLKVINEDSVKNCFISEFSVHLGDVLIAKLEKEIKDGTDTDPEELNHINSKNDLKTRWLTLDSESEFLSPSLMMRMHSLAKNDNIENIENIFSKSGNGYRLHQWVTSGSLSPRKLIPDAFVHVAYLEGERENICKNLADIFFYLGAMLWSPLRDSPGLVHSDRRAPKPEEALTVVDLSLRGWWDESSFSPSSPAFLLKSYARPLDEHYQGLAEVAHAELLLKAGNHDFWGGAHAAKHISHVKSRSKVLDRVNHHLEKSLFTEKLYRLTCASTLMVPIDLREDDPWGYYALAQPAAVRLFLQDSTGQKVDLHDVGSGVPFVLPVLYAVSAQGFIGVQQPELHLHPALQSSLADVFIEELHRENCGQFVIETHSEHFLLRLLRRIRHTEKGKTLSEDNKLTNDQIAVYYFDPQVGGGTIVSRQLVTPLGDFYNDWPRGFFSERNDDLFDE
jgi:predicted ATPase